MPRESPRSRSPRFGIRGAALAVAGFPALDPAPGPAEPMEIGSPTFDWYLSSLLFRGPADYTDEIVVDPPPQVGGGVDDAFEASLFADAEPDAAAFSTSARNRIWSGEGMVGYGPLCSGVARRSGCSTDGLATA